MPKFANNGTPDGGILSELWQGGQEGPLAGIRVVDFGQYIAGPLLAMLLADQGADVIRVDPPAGPRWDSPVNATLLRGRRNISLNLKDEADCARAQTLIASADIVIENFRPGVATRLGIGPAACMALAPRLIYCSLPGFGSDDPRAGIAGWDGVVMAAAGAYALGSPAASMVLFSPLTLGSVFAAIEAAGAAVAALIARDRDGLGQHVEVPLFDALFEACGSGSMSMERTPPMQLADFAPGWYRCADGRFVNLISLWFRHHEAFLRAAGCGSWIDEGLLTFERLQTDPKAGPELKARMIELFKQRPAREWETLGQANGSTVAMAKSMAEWMAEPHSIESGTLVDIDDPILGRTRVPGLAVQVSTTGKTIAPPRKAPGSNNIELLPILDSLARNGSAAFDQPAKTQPVALPPLAGVRVLDFTRVMAGPTACRILGQYGADVIKIDSTRSDQRAMIPLPIAHIFANRGKRSIDLDLSDSANAQATRRLFADADIVFQNFTLGVAERLGIDANSAREFNPGLVFAYLNAHGTQGPLANVRGYAELANTETGITERSNGDRTIESGTHSLAFDLPRWQFTDYGAGVLGAFAALLGLYERNRTGVAPSVDTSLIRITTLEQITYLIDYENRDIHEPRGPALGWSPLQQIYHADDGAVFIGAKPDQASTLLQTFGIATLEDLAAAISKRSVTALESTLLGLDIGVHRVELLSNVTGPEGAMAQRGLRIEDDTDEMGRVAMLGPVARLSRTRLVAGTLPLPFGAETDEILMSNTAAAHG